MTKRITVMIDDDNHKKLRALQVKMIVKSDGIVSFSKVINETIKKGL
jgi:predicted CopG family antitoxin